MSNSIAQKIRRLYLWLVGGPPDEETRRGTSDLTARLQGVNFQEAPEDAEAAERLAKASETKGDALAATVYMGRPRNPLSD